MTGISNQKLQLTKGLYIELGVPEIVEKGKPYLLLWKNSDGQRLILCIVTSQTS